MSTESPDEARDLSRRLDRALPPSTHAVNGSDGDPLVEAARRLAQAPRPVLSSAAQQRIEARLRERALAMQPVRSRTAQCSSRLRPLVWAWRAALTLVVIVALLGAGAIQVSASSLPGDSLYPVKRAFEDARLSLVSTDSEPTLRIDLADRRVDEFEALLDHSRVYLRALDEANDHLERALDLSTRGYGSRAAISRDVLALTRRQARLIGQAVSLASAEETQRLQALVARVDAIQDRAAAPGGTTTPPVLPAHTVTPLPPTSSPADTPRPTQTPLLPTDTPRPTQTTQPSVTPPPTNTPRFTPTPSETAAPSPTPAPTIAPTTTALPSSNEPSSSNSASVESPTRTPPGHGPTPGLGQNPPGQGGDNPGVGNNGNPPGQSNKPPKDK